MDARYGAPWLAKSFTAMSAALLLSGYYYANIRFVPVALGAGILAVVCGVRRVRGSIDKALTQSGKFRAL